jgi:hypothetical protein
VSSKSSPAWFFAVLLVVVGGYQVWKHEPPYERGVHNVVVQAGSASDASDAPHVGNCAVFPADNVWNTPIDGLARDKHAQDYVDTIGPLHAIHPDFGSGLDFGIPYTEIPAGTRPVPVEFDYHDESDLGSYPLFAEVPIEGGGRAMGDRHILMVDTRTCVLYELFDAHPQPGGGWKAGSGIKMDLTSNSLRPDGHGSADAAGLPILPGLVRYSEVASGSIRHALRFTVPKTQAAYVWPARHKASHNVGLNFPPMGERFRLRADFDVSRYSKTNQVIMKALKKYGMFLADNGGAMFLSGVSDKRWDDSDLHKLGEMKAEDFEAVDESGLQMMPDSARVDVGALGNAVKR